MGVRPHGAISLLIPEDHFDYHIKPAMEWTHRSHSCPDPYPTTMYASLSPIRFESAKGLSDMLKDLRPVKAGTRGCDDSKLNKYMKVGDLKPERGMFEQARLLWQILYANRENLPSIYGLPTLPSTLRLVYFALTFWIDPLTYDISENEELQVLDFGWHEPSTDTTKHYIIEEYASMSKGSLNKAAFAHGESTTIPESEVANALRTLFTGPHPIVLVTHDWPRTSRFLASQGINTNSSTCYSGIGKLLGFERSPVPSGPTAVNHRRGSDGRCVDSGLREIKDEDNKPANYGGRRDPSPNSPRDERERDRRSLSPRSRTRPLAREEDRRHRPIFRPDEEAEEAEEGQIIELAPMPDTHVIDIRELFIALAATRRPFVLYPSMANRLGFEVGGWCAGNWARQFFDVFTSLVGGSPIHRRIEEFKKTPGVTPQSQPRQAGIPTVLEGIAGGTNEQAQAAWGDSSDDEDY
ncbi:hypothetical protein RSOLAG22IIIB_07467 [Rhizoctonia solani]|uniref:Uncharacterized protein n=1 Tax=Rhizoctonia solani TaxID=456999 RepID=A0A0K6FNN7_9AGAM|nr:hypothetical protein RSOLAG22IIIB_07467 [Rhizoctonia solani]